MSPLIRKFEEVFNKWSWKPIRNCPGRYTYAEGVSYLTIVEVAGHDFPFFEYASKIVPDKVLVMKFGDGSGGIISYCKEPNSFLHTLNDEAGFSRKLKQLQIEF